jgi:chemotaxis protein methyltransferase CheR
VTFEAANVLDGAALATDASWDVVFCRNMMMYFTEDRADALIARLTRAIAPGGYLFLGHAENLRGRTDRFTLCHTHGTFYYQCQPASSAIELTRTLAAYQPAEPATASLDAGWCADIHAATQRVHAMVDGALDQVPGRGGDATLDPPARLAPRPTTARSAAVADLEAVHGLLAQERFGEALLRLDQLRSAGIVDRDTVMLRALVLTHTGQFADARIACAELLTIDGTSAGANYLLALCCDSTGDTGGAARMAQRATELDPSFAMAHLHLGLLARRSGDRVIASRELTRAIALLEREAPARLALYGGGFSRQTLLGMCRAELSAIGAAR